MNDKGDVTDNDGVLAFNLSLCAEDGRMAVINIADEPMLRMLISRLHCWSMHAPVRREGNPVYRTENTEIYPLRYLWVSNTNLRRESVHGCKICCLEGKFDLGIKTSPPDLHLYFRFA